LYHRPKAQLFAEFLGDAVGFGDVLGKIPAVLPGDRLSRAANVADSSLIGLGCVHGDSP
jgi:hypothetical protein